MTFPSEVVKAYAAPTADQARDAYSHGSIYLSALTLRIKESDVAC
jgi:hypothetical protein